LDKPCEMRQVTSNGRTFVHDLMIEYKVLRKLVFEVLKNSPRLNFTAIVPRVGELAASSDVFPTEEDCRKKSIDYTYYSQRRLNPGDELNVSQIIWDLIVDR